MAFLEVFIACLFAFIVFMVAAYTLIKHRWLPRAQHWFASELQPKVMAEMTGSAVDDLVQVVNACPTCMRSYEPVIAIQYTCEDHGRCEGCPRVLRQFEAIERIQGRATMSELELQHLGMLQAMLSLNPSLRLLCPRCKQDYPHLWANCEASSTENATR